MNRPGDAQSAESSPIFVDVVLNGTLLHGRLREIDSGRRLVDTLNSNDASLKLTLVKITDWEGRSLAFLPELAIEKQHILAAIPAETEDYRRQRRVSAMGMAHSSMKAVPLLALLPPLVIEGVAYVHPHVIALRPDASIFGRFIPLTDAVLRLTTQITIDTAIAVVNRDMIAAISVTKGRESGTSGPAVVSRDE